MKERKLKLSSSIPDREFHSHEFHQGMVDRMILSHYKYHATPDKYLTRSFAEGRIKEQNALEQILVRLQMYRETGNTEWLIDVANCAMIEFMFPSLPNAHFRPTDSDESPGIGKSKED